jgi:hypothetical protein
MDEHAWFGLVADNGTLYLLMSGGVVSCYSAFASIISSTYKGLCIRKLGESARRRHATAWQLPCVF